MVQYGGRYRYQEAGKVQKLLAEQEGLKLNYVVIHPGSSGPLHQSVLAFTSPTRPLIMADPSYESAGRAAQLVGSKIIKVPLTKDYAHDVKAMVAASPNAGLILHRQSQQPDRDAYVASRSRMAGRQQAEGISGHDRRSLHPLLERPVQQPDGSGGQGRHHSADLLEDLRYGGSSRRRSPGTSGSARADQ